MQLIGKTLSYKKAYDACNSNFIITSFTWEDSKWVPTTHTGITNVRSKPAIILIISDEANFVSVFLVI